MKPDERLEYLVALALEAYDSTKAPTRTIAEAFYQAMKRDLFKLRLRERMAQAAQTWTFEADE